MKVKSTICGLMALVAFVAAAMAALRTNDSGSVAIILIFTVVTLCTATVLGLDRRGPWAGFAIFGWALFFICQPMSAPPVGPTTLPMEVACRVILSLRDPVQFPSPTFQIRGYPAIMADGNGEPFLSAVVGGSGGFIGFVPVNTLRSALCLSSLLFGLVGAIVGGLFARGRTTRNDGRYL